MPQLLTLSRAARLVGISRGALQKRIKDGDLPTFEGKIAAADLVQMYPHAHLDQNRELERVQRIKETAFAKRVRERALPDADTLAARLEEIGRELAHSRGLAEHYRNVLESVRRELSRHGDNTNAPLAALAARLQTELQHPILPPNHTGSLLAHDSVLRVMTAHVRTHPVNHDYFVEGSDSLLEAGLRAGLALNYGCSDGSCGLCKGRVLAGRTKAIRDVPYELSAQEKRNGHVLMCAQTAVTDVVIDVAEAAGPRDIPTQQVQTRVKGIVHANARVALLHLRTPPEQRMRFLAGQSFRLTLTNGLTADLPGAGCPCDERNLYFHVRRDAGEFAVAVFNKLKDGQRVDVTGPYGDFVLQQDSPRAVLFLAYDAGFAAIKGMIEHAMALDSAPDLYLYWFAPAEGEHYLDNLCRSWADALDDFHYFPIVAVAESNAISHALQEMGADHASIQDFDVYAAGPEVFTAAVVETLNARAFPTSQLRTATIA